MHLGTSRRLSPAFVVAMIALFVALGGTAGAVVTATVPLAKRALTADNAKKLGGQTSAQLVSQASKAAQTAAQAPGPGEHGCRSRDDQDADRADRGRRRQDFSVACDAGQRSSAEASRRARSSSGSTRIRPTTPPGASSSAISTTALRPTSASTRPASSRGAGEHDGRRRGPPSSAGGCRLRTEQAPRPRMRPQRRARCRRRGGAGRPPSTRAP